MLPNIVLTEDGSITCREPHSGELYHNRAGAYTEALYNYVKTCDIAERLKNQDKIVVLDSCFGLGYNSFVFIDHLLQLFAQDNCNQTPASCHIIGIDKDREITNLLPEVLAQSQFDSFRKTLNINARSVKKIADTLKKTGQHSFHLQNQTSVSILLELKFIDLRQAVLKLVSSAKKFDYIFHDGFSPRLMPELWTFDLFSQYTKLLKENGRIITYSSACAVRGALKECGLEVRKTIALGGKSGGTIAFKNTQLEIVNNETIFFLAQEENDRLSNRSRIPYRDPSLSDSQSQIVCRRESEIKQSSLPAYKRSLDS